MRVLLLNHFPLTGSGSGVYTANLATSLTKLGVRVKAIFPDNTTPQEKYSFDIEPVNFNNDQLQSEQEPSEISDKLSFNFPCFTTHPRSLQTFDDLKDEQLDQYIEAFRNAIKNAIETFKPDIIHCGHIWILPAIASEFDIPVVITCHGTDLMGIESSKLSDFGRKAASQASAIVSISKGNLEKLESVLPEHKDKFHLLTNGFNDDVFYPEKVSKEECLSLFGIEGNYEKIVSFAGKFAHFKGIDVLLRANAIYDEEKVATILAGDGELFDELSKLKDELNLKNTFFIHNQPHNKLRALYSAADVSLVPSRNEPFGLVAIEAGACGAPVIASNSGGLKDIIKKETGLLFEQENASELATCVQRVLGGEILFDREKVACATKENFSQDEKTKLLIEEVYKPLIKS